MTGLFKRMSLLKEVAAHSPLCLLCTTVECFLYVPLLFPPPLPVTADFRDLLLHNLHGYIVQLRRHAKMVMEWYYNNSLHDSVLHSIAACLSPLLTTLPFSSTSPSHVFYPPFLRASPLPPLPSSLLLLPLPLPLPPPSGTRSLHDASSVQC